MFWTIVLALLFVFVGIPLLIVIGTNLFWVVRYWITGRWE